MFGWASQRYAISVDQCRVGNTTFWYFVCWQHVIQYFGKHLHVRTPTRGKKISPPRTCCGCMSQDFSDRTSNWTRNPRIWNYEPCTFVATCRDLISMPDNCGGYDSTLEIQSFSFLWPFEEKNAILAPQHSTKCRNGGSKRTKCQTRRNGPIWLTQTAWFDANLRCMIGCAQTSGWDMHQKDTPAGMHSETNYRLAQPKHSHEEADWFQHRKKKIFFFLHEKNDFCGRSFFMPRLKHRSWAQWPPPETLRRLNTPNIGTINDNHTFKLQTLFYSRMECYQPFHHFVKRAIRERFGQQNYHVHPRCFYSVLVRTTATQSCRWSLRINAVQGVWKG